MMFNEENKDVITLNVLPSDDFMEIENREKSEDSVKTVQQIIVGEMQPLYFFNV